LQVENKLLQFKFCTTIRMKGGPKYEYEHLIDEEKAEKDFGAVIKRSRGVAESMSKGVQFLMKKNNLVSGWVMVLS
ncbi:MAG: hypothetical protein ACK4IX_00585, partial [Candidatus Sericytochromatia bacterium]